MRPVSRYTAFTLVELLVVIGIIALLIAILLPALNRANEQAKTVQCLSNLRQMVISANIYADAYNGSYPIAYYTDVRPPVTTSYNWDFTTTFDSSTGQLTVVPGLLWQGSTNPQVQQCPSFDGNSNTLDDPYTGYNYNTSFIGHGDLEMIVAPLKINQVRQPQRCAMFGDGQYAAGADKFMRSPFPSPSDTNFLNRYSGTQGFRHHNGTNVAFCDGHAETLFDCYTTTITTPVQTIAPGTGFLDEDNSLYDPQQ